jgi:hypothetical protein
MEMTIEAMIQSVLVMADYQIGSSFLVAMFMSSAIALTAASHNALK